MDVLGSTLSYKISLSYAGSPTWKPVNSDVSQITKCFLTIFNDIQYDPIHLPTPGRGSVDDEPQSCHVLLPWPIVGDSKNWRQEDVPIRLGNWHWPTWVRGGLVRLQLQPMTSRMSSKRTGKRCLVPKVESDSIRREIPLRGFCSRQAVNHEWRLAGRQIMEGVL